MRTALLTVQNSYEMEINDLIISQCKIYDLSLAKLAKELGMTYPTLWRKMNEPERFTLGELFDLADAIGVPVCKLIEKTQPE